MLQLLVRNAGLWWQRVDGPALVRDFAVEEPRRHIAEPPF